MKMTILITGAAENLGALLSKYIQGNDIGRESPCPH